MKLKVLISMILVQLTTSCANQVYSTSYSPINVKYAKELNQIKLGSTKEELLTILPDLVPRGQAYVGNQVVEAQELQHNYWNGVGGNLKHDLMWFYLHDNKLIKWGKANDWPQSPDLIIENRMR